MNAPLARRMSRVASLVALALLPVWPTGSYLLFVPLGFTSWWLPRSTRRWTNRATLQPIIVVAATCALGAVMHVAASTRPTGVADDVAVVAHDTAGSHVGLTGDSDAVNLVPADLGPTLRGHAYGRSVVAYGAYRGNGYWTVPRFEPLTGIEVHRIIGSGEVDVVAGRPYTTSFVVLDALPAGSFQVAFRTDQGTTFVPPRVAPSRDGGWRVEATWTPEADATLVHAFEIARFEGAWESVTLGRVQFEQASHASSYQLPSTPPTVHRSSVGEGVAWWLGTGALMIATSLGLVATFRLASRRGAGLAIVGGLTTHVVVGILSSPGSRAFGLASHPNVLGHGAVAAGLLAWGYAPRPVGWAALASSGVLVVLSGSRSAFALWLAWSIIAASVAVARLASTRVAVASLVGVIAIAAAFAAFGPERLRSTFDVTDANVGRRMALWEVAEGAIRAHPWTGVGQGGFADYLVWNRPVGSAAPRAHHAHDLLLHVAAESGVLVALGLAALIASTAWALVRRRAWWAVFGLASITALNLQDVTFFSGYVLIPFLAFVASTMGNEDSSLPANT